MTGSDDSPHCSLGHLPSSLAICQMDLVEFLDSFDMLVGTLFLITRHVIGALAALKLCQDGKCFDHIALGESGGHPTRQNLGLWDWIRLVYGAAQVKSVTTLI